MATEGKPSPISKRIRLIVDREEGGNVSAASRRLGISQRGLQKIYTGETAFPGADVLAAIVRKYGIDAHWLVTGVKSKDMATQTDLIEGLVRRQTATLLHGLATLMDQGTGSDGGVDGQETPNPAALRNAAARVSELIDAKEKVS